MPLASLLVPALSFSDSLCWFSDIAVRLCDITSKDCVSSEGSSCVGFGCGGGGTACFKAALSIGIGYPRPRTPHLHQTRRRWDLRPINRPLVAVVASYVCHPRYLETRTGREIRAGHSHTPNLGRCRTGIWPHAVTNVRHFEIQIYKKQRHRNQTLFNEKVRNTCTICM